LEEDTMKKVIIMLLTCVFISGVAYAAEETGKGVSIDLSLKWGLGNKDIYPSSLFQGTAGPELGVNVDFKTMGINLGPFNGFKLQGRASISYYDWKGDFGIKDEYRRIPLFVGIRGTVPLGTKYVALYGQVGPEVSFDHQEDYLGGRKVSDNDEVRVGITPGAGILFNISRISLGLGFNYHFIKDPFSTFGLSIGYNF
jgi:hypothetical protein